MILLPACHPPPPLPLLASFSCVAIRRRHSLRRAASRRHHHSLRRQPPSPAPAVTPYVASPRRQPRGSGTSGHIKASKFLAKPRPSSSATTAAGGYETPNPPQTGSSLERTRKPNKDILEHDRKWQVELRLLVLRDALEEQGYTEAQIEDSVGEARKAAENKAAAEEGGPRSQGKGFTDTQSHQAAARKENQLQTMRGALGLDAEDAQKKGAL